MAGFDTNAVRAVQSQSLAGVICEQLEEMILAGKIQPGERINESQLSSLLGVSRAPIREACRQLERHGMVEVRVNRGTFVKEIDLQELEELYEIRSALDALAGEKAAQVITNQELEELQVPLEAMGAATRSEDHKLYYQANLDFHMCIMHIAGNKNLISIYEGVCKKASLFRRTSLSLPGRLPESLRQHQAIYTAIAEHDETQAATLMRHHIVDAKIALVAACQKSEDQ